MPPANFNFHTTADEAAAHFAAEIEGKTVIITGASLGSLGGETARIVAKYRAGLVVLAGRSQAKLEETETAVLKETPKANLRKLLVDLGSFEAIRKAADEVNSYKESVDVLINNAGISTATYRTTIEGHEANFGTNHLGTFLFTNLILSKLQASAAPRIVNISSSMHLWADFNYDDQSYESGAKWTSPTAYCNSKLANVLFTTAAVKKWSRVKSVVVNPGLVPTGLVRELDLATRVAMKLAKEDGSLGPGPEFSPYKTLEEGAAGHIIGAFDPELASGSYLDDCQLAEVRPDALDMANAEKLWAMSEKLVGQTFA